MARIQAMGLAAEAFDCVREGLREQAETARMTLDFDTFMRAKSTVRLLEKAATAEASTVARIRREPGYLGKSIGDLVATLVNRLEALPSDEFLDLRTYDAYLYSHPVNMAMIGMAIGKALGMGRLQLEELGMAGLLADAGKFRLPRDLLFKGEALTAQELLDVRRHVSFSLELVSAWKLLVGPVVEAVACHHEKYD
ncbi:MAG: HD domain-containing protein [Candidatus Sericytochromatia bacterium]|uniref:HD domain-containing protein n=1 Tax=Candidatus Tanganyikabacteria bacterium TaxID=2961651 RepID=A0A937X396_9BACT|nr:HD domain-containing protein [Candidatus Tanganyikabacteria bacterium]